MNTAVTKEKLIIQSEEGKTEKIYIIFFLTFMSLLGIGTGLWGIHGGTYHLFILVFIGLGASFIGTLAGGAGLITVPGMMLIGIPIQTSIATNKFSSGLAAISSVFYLIRNKQLTLKSILSNLFIAFSGGIGGSLVTSTIQEETMNGIAFFLLCVAFLATLKNKEWTANIQLEQPSITNKTKLYIPFLVAAYDGGFGPGSSTFSILYYMKNCHTYRKAVQMTRVLILGSCTGGFIVFYQNGFIHWSYAISMAIGSILGSQLGLLLLPKIPPKTAKTLLLFIIGLLMIQMIYKLL